ncbi:MAG: hypothetical protein ACPGVG_14390 [Mycobacterium sp.]
MTIKARLTMAGGNYRVARFEALKPDQEIDIQLSMEDLPKVAMHFGREFEIELRPILEEPPARAKVKEGAVVSSPDDPGEGYRFLKDEEIIEIKDQYLCDCGRWTDLETDAEEIGEPFVEDLHVPFRRKQVSIIEAFDELSKIVDGAYDYVDANRYVAAIRGKSDETVEDVMRDADAERAKRVG